MHCRPLVIAAIGGLVLASHVLRADLEPGLFPSCIRLSARQAFFC
jgi:hypothetical protein